MNAVDAAGVHPLMLAIGSERYQPYVERSQPQEVLTQANAILGQGQMSLAKYLLIVAGEDDPALKVTDAVGFFQHVLSRIVWKRDLHFQTCTTMDTLDYSSQRLNEGSKVVWAAVGPVSRELGREVPSGLRAVEGFGQAHVVAPGILAVTSPAARGEDYRHDVRRFCAEQGDDLAVTFPLIILVDDSEFTARSFDKLSVGHVYRSDPAADIDGVSSFVEEKHWGCAGSLVIDARIKPHQAPQLSEDPEVSARVDALAARGGPPVALALVLLNYTRRPVHPTERATRLFPASLPWDPELQANLDRIVSSPSYQLAELDTDFLTRPELRPTRMQLELRKPEMTLTEHGVESTVVVFGGTQVVAADEAQRRVEAAEAAVQADPEDRDAQRQLQRAQRMAAKSKYYEAAREFASLVSSACQTQGMCDYVIKTVAARGSWRRPTEAPMR